jgi:hypothetical protein
MRLFASLYGSWLVHVTGLAALTPSGFDILSGSKAQLPERVRSRLCTGSLACAERQVKEKPNIAMCRYFIYIDILGYRTNTSRFPLYGERREAECKKNSGIRLFHGSRRTEDFLKDGRVA